ncbi:hypothetical protein JK359_09685 [Streptomyces actinomycinicus]|uniref:Mercury transporter n=1 Tax=Streptomyces actinomycinicus TaxID=1695166 RepID=A0A937EGB9_9ACTN|nr:hypothetical protein [Streptomyces actinomycinicus]
MCCAGPLMAVLGGLGVASAIGALWMPALAVLIVAAGLAALVVRHRRRTTSCHRAPAPVDLGMPTAGPRPGAEGSDATR